MSQGNDQLSTIDAAANSLMESGAMDAIMGEQPQEVETDNPEVDEEVEVEEQEPSSQEYDEADESEEAGEADDEEETELEEQDEENSEEPESEEEHVEIETLDQLAENLGVSVEELLDNLKMDLVIDGETQSVNLRDARDGHQRESDYRRKTGELAEQRRAFEAESSQLNEQVQYQHSVAASLITQAEQQLMGELQQIDFDQLQQTDPVA